MRQVYGAIVELEAEGFSVAALCDSLAVTRSAFYGWLHGELGARGKENEQLRLIVRSIFWEHQRRYGARRIAQELAARQLPGSRRRVGRLMEEMGLVAIQPRSFKPRTTDSRHKLGYSPNLLLDFGQPTAINQLWVGDITYIPLVAREYLYLAMLMDQYSRRIVAWDLRENMQEGLVLAALRSAIVSRQPSRGLIHHTDRGGQYAGTAYRNLLERARIQQSMSRADNCYDNAFMESCFGTLKSELEMKPYESRQVARKEIADYIRYYNTRRRHSSLNYMTPEEYERGR